MTRSGGSGPYADTPFAGTPRVKAALAERTGEAEKQTLLASCPTARGVWGQRSSAARWQGCLYRSGISDALPAAAGDASASADGELLCALSIESGETIANKPRLKKGWAVALAGSSLLIVDEAPSGDLACTTALALPS